MTPTALDRLLVQMLPLVPRRIVGRVSSRYIAGAELEAALGTVARLHAKGFGTTVDVLGEFVSDVAEVDQAAREYAGLLDGLRPYAGQAQASLKLTQFGLKLDAPACADHVRQLVRQAKSFGGLVTIDMEDSSCTDATLDLFEQLRAESDAVGVVLQARLHRSQKDVERLLSLQPHVRICKGIYLEPASIAYQDPDDIRRSFLDLVDAMLSRPSIVGIATHDEILVQRSLELLRKHRAEKDRYEFQVLLGVREELRARLLRDGHPVRVYVPYGEQWYAYSLRRLKENPAIAGQVLRSLFTRT